MKPEFSEKPQAGINRKTRISELIHQLENGLAQAASRPDLGNLCLQLADELRRVMSASLTEDELAARWRISVRTLQNARVQGTGVHFHKVGRCVRYRLCDIYDYELANRVRSTCEFQEGGR